MSQLRVAGLGASLGGRAVLEGVDLAGELVELFEGAAFAGSEDLVDQGHGDSCGSFPGRCAPRAPMRRSSLRSSQALSRLGAEISGKNHEDACFRLLQPTG